MNQVAEIRGVEPSARDGGDTLGRGRRRGRLAALVVLAAVLTLLGRAGVTAYRAATDAFVTPITLSPDSDAVLQDKLALSRLLSEREGLAARIVEGTAALETLRGSLDLLHRLERSAVRSLAWAREQLATEQARGATDRELLKEQQQKLEAAVARQRRYVAELDRSLSAGLLHEVDVEREQGYLDQAELSLLRIGRERVDAAAQEKKTASADRALRGGPGPEISTPEMQAQEELTTRIRIDLLRAQSDLSVRLSRLSSDREELARVDELVAQLRERPTLKAVAESQHLAFAPYAAIDEVRAGAPVFHCPIWGLLGCSRVGTVARVLPGEVASQDAWGIAARGQYVLLDLSDRSAARARALRIRPSRGGPSGQGTLLSAR